MEITSYRFELGAFDCLAITDGTHDYPLKNFFANTPLAQTEAALRERGQPVGGRRSARGRRHTDHARTP